MIDFAKQIAEWCALIMEVMGVAIIAVVAIYALSFGLIMLLKKKEYETIFNKVRQRLGRGILLGLEFLVAADIIHTVAVDLTFHTLGVLAIIVIVRTFLSFTLHVELTGNWPWQNKE